MKEDSVDGGRRNHTILALQIAAPSSRRRLKPQWISVGTRSNSRCHHPLPEVVEDETPPLVQGRRPRRRALRNRWQPPPSVAASIIPPGTFGLKSNRETRVGSSRSCEEHRGWLSLWSADVPGKARIHVWRLVKNGLAVGTELERRKIKHGVKCIACNREESLLHRFWVCPHSVAIWEMAREASGFQLPSPRQATHRATDLKGWLLDWLGSLSDKELSLGIMVLYQTWLARNEARDEVRIEDPGAIARRSLAMVEEWLAIKSGPRHEAQRVKEHWLPPDDGWHKVNADGAYKASLGSGGCGVVIRDHKGVFVAAECHFLPSVSDPERVELLACKRALVLARRKGIRRVCLETDCLSAVAKIKSSELDRSFHGPLVEEIKELLKMFADHKEFHVLVYNWVH
ncbi:hypothetical protein QYE76_024164 [Lolium multiflorum]|uniref:RNase H type-1 domain-containing protein n=1 Tax=Lolium multiflorum TaxID=4521 RepID=A0AAD8VT10_LOLMU|nr:hypothetical protein QYE76_024164 [Lolium multiflorum]